MSFPGLPSGESPEARRRRLAKEAAARAAKSSDKGSGALVSVGGNSNGWNKFLSDTGKNFDRALFDAGNAITGTAKNVGNTVGGWFNTYGDAVHDVFTNKSGATRQPVASKPRGAGRVGAPQQAGPPGFMDILSELSAAFGDQGGGGGGVDIGSYTPVNYDPARDEAKASAAAAAQALQGIYTQLNSEFAQTGADTDKRYADAQAQIGQNRDQAVQSTQDAYAASQGQQQSMLNTLGIQNEAARAIEEGRDLAGRGAGAVAGLNSGAAANQNFLASSGAGENRFNGRLQQAGQAAGARAQGGVQSNLASKLAEIAMAEEQANAQGRASWQSAAAQAASQQASGGMDMESIANIALKLMENQQSQDRNLTTDAIAMNKGNSAANNLAILQQLIKQNPGIDPEQLKIYASVLR